ncbi:MAG: hypothetical protein JWM53_4330 [bacterium]|nr:hypothetical protein [bacterium]
MRGVAGYDSQGIVRCKQCGLDAFLSVKTPTDDGVAEVPLCDDCFAWAESRGRHDDHDVDAIAAR